MSYLSAKHLLEIIVLRLRTEPPQDEEEWQAQTAVVQAVFEEMSERRVNQPKEDAPQNVHQPVAKKLNRAMPHLQSMLTAMQNRDRTTALAHGETTLQRFRER